jgi:hypothetical protein
MDPWAERMARNEALYRDVNERLKELGESFSVVADKAVFVCECGSAECAERLSLTLQEYEQVRREPTHFIVKRGHEMPDDAVIAQSDQFAVVEKRPGGPAEFAITHDPRN